MGCIISNPEPPTFYRDQPPPLPPLPPLDMIEIDQCFQLGANIDPIGDRVVMATLTEKGRALLNRPEQELPEQVALKFYVLQGNTYEYINEPAIHEFVAEHTILEQCSSKVNPNLIEYYGSYRYDKGIVTVLRRYEDQHIEHVSLRQLPQLLHQAAQTIYDLHQHNVAHRDIKIDNFLVEMKSDGSLRPVLIDFGLSYYGQTPYIVYAGTGVYLDLYLYSYLQPSLRDYQMADWWSLAVMVHGLFTKQIPLVARRDIQSHAAIEQERLIRGNIPQPWRSFVNRTLIKNQRNRITPEQIKELLRLQD